MPENRRQGSVFLPLILIALGVLLLLNNLGYLPWSVWERLVQLWPVLLIAAGIDLILSRGFWRWWFAILIVMIVVGSGLAVFELGIRPAWSTVEEHVHENLDATERLTLELSCRHCSISLGATDEPDALLVGTITRSRNESVTKELSTSNGDTRFTVLSQQPSERVGLLTPPRDSKDWELALNPDIPTELIIEAGQGAVDLALSLLPISTLSVTSSDQISVDFPTSGATQATIAGQNGDIKLRVPQKAAARIEATITGTGELRLPDTYASKNGAYVSGNDETASAKIEIRVSAEDGNITVLGPED